MTFSQTTDNSTQTETEEQRRVRLVAALERAQDEVKVSRKYIDSLESQVKSKTKIIEAQEKRQTLADEAIESLKKEVSILKAQIAEKDRMISIYQAEAEFLKKELDKTNRKLKRSRGLNKFLIVVSGVLILTSILK